jgi:hypothetical protein
MASEINFRHERFDLNTVTSELSPGSTNILQVSRTLKCEASGMIIGKGGMSKLKYFPLSQTQTFTYFPVATKGHVQGAN